MSRNLGRITFRNSRSSGVYFSQLGSGLYDHLTWAGAGGQGNAIEIGQWNDSTYISRSNGFSPSVFGGSGYMTNCKYITSTTVKISGLPRGPYQKPISQVNVFNVANLTTAPNFRNRGSGTLLIQYTASGTSKVNTFNAKIYAFDNTLTVADPPPDCTVMGFEINASGTAYNAAHSGQWHAMAGRDNALLFVDHSSANRWRSAHTHIWVCAISVRPNVVGTIDTFDFAFSTQFA